MTWAEFRIRSYAYQRMQKTEWFKIRELAWASTIGPHLDPKKLPKSKEAFIPLDLKGKEELNDKRKEAFIKARLKYEQQIKSKLDG
tara:strand:- start:6531 stop:6788 length:258 start_codon:yes stop_codon:yes gene_type:complete